MLNGLIYLDCSARINFNKPEGVGAIKGAPASFKSLFDEVNQKRISKLSDLIKN